MVKFGLNRLFRSIKRSQNGVYKRVFDGNDKSKIVLTPSSIKYQIILLVLVTCFMLYALFLVPFEGSDLPSCRSIYMYPSYAKLNDMDSFQQTRFANKYHLYLYREQEIDPTPISSSNEILLDGIPVLFIPGNAGSFKQGRSIAAQAANYYYSKNDQSLLSLEDKHNKKNLDFYTLDFNEDFTAFHGQTMLDQAEFVNDCVKFILSLYQLSKGTTTDTYGPLPTSVIIVGHSMGGIVSRVLPLLDNYVPESINTILTLSSPHSLSPLSFDGDLLKVYKKIDEFWVKEFNNPSSFIYNNVSIISITGGILDDVLPSDYTLIESVLNDVAPLNNGLTVYTSGIPKVWTSIDHLAVVWCDQLRKVVAKMLLELVDKDSSSKTIDLQKRMSLFQLSLLDNNVFENNRILANDSISTSNEATSFKTLKFTGDSIEIDSLNDKAKHIVSLSSLKLSTFWDLEIISSSETFRNVDISLCDSYFRCRKISYLFKDIPNSMLNTLEESTTDDRSDKSLTLINKTIKEYEYLKVNVKEQIHNKLTIAKFKTDKNINVKFIDLLLFGKEIPVNSNDKIQLFNIHTFISSNIAFKLKIDGDFTTNENNPLLKQYISEPYETKWHILKPETKSLSITTAVNPPFIPTTTNNHMIQLKLYNYDQQVHSLKLKIDFTHTLKLIVRRYRLSFATFPIGLVSIMFLFQIRGFAITGEFFFMAKCLKYYCSLVTVWGLVLCGFIELLLQSNVIRKTINIVDCVMVNDNLFNKAYSKYQKNEFLGNAGLSLDNIFIDYLVLLLSLVLVMLTGGLILAVEMLANKFKAHHQRNQAEEAHKEEEHDEEEEKKKNKKRALKQILTLGRLLKFGVLIFAVVFYVPYQLIFVLLTISHLFYVVILFFSSTKRNRNIVEFNKTILLMMLLILPVCIPIVVVFLHNFAVNWKTPFRSHHNILAIFPIISLVFCLQNDMMLKQEKNFNFRLTCFLLSYMCFFSFVFGVRNTYFIYHLFNLLSCTLCMGMF